VLRGETLYKHIKVKQIFFQKEWDCKVPKSITSRPKTELKVMGQQKSCAFVRECAFTYVFLIVVCTVSNSLLVHVNRASSKASGLIHKK